MPFQLQPYLVVIFCLIGYLSPVNGAPMQGMPVSLGTFPAIRQEPRILGTLVPRAPVDYSVITIDLAKDLYNTYDEHTSASGIDARPNTPYRGNAIPPPPQNQNERISGHGTGHSSGNLAVNTAADSRPGEGNIARPNTAASNRSSRPNTPALGTMQINSGQFPSRTRGQSTAGSAASPVSTARS